MRYYFDKKKECLCVVLTVISALTLLAGIGALIYKLCHRHSYCLCDDEFEDWDDCDDCDCDCNCDESSDTDEDDCKF